ncbi:hypothetical protein AK812_SmicGene19738 [Symbiodinium microadriaticum]|uniref:Uncharacterized protein n=1 Tax=Symbiodinium microadriaticum TaxID=2951 RepID=A0A1Q9DRU0_SYMMI|nr:hypothetical protein AK812_SmicGene19738 [Symbiodinium microadriaticum]
MLRCACRLYAKKSALAPVSLRLPWAVRYLSSGWRSSTVQLGNVAGKRGLWQRVRACLTLYHFYIAFCTFMFFYPVLYPGLDPIFEGLFAFTGIRRARQSRHLPYGLTEEKDLFNFLLNADIRLVRAEYFQELRKAGRLWPRRQEAENELLRDGRSVLVARQEVEELHRFATFEKCVRQWRLVFGLADQSANSFIKTQTVPKYDPVNYRAKRTSLEATVVPNSFGRFGKRKRVRIVSVSHAWEAMQHPDPWGFQLQELCKHLSALRTDDAEEHETWVFVDFLSLYQYKRSPGQQKSFHHAMGHMHCLYAHAGISEVVRLEELTPDTDKPEHPKPIEIYNARTDSCETRPFEELVQNSTPYSFRSWCRAEVQWASTHHAIVEYAPMLPKNFSQRVRAGFLGASGSGMVLKFTHRSDADCVIELQARVFNKVVPLRTSLTASNLSAEEVAFLVEALPEYRSLRVLWIKDSDARCREVDWSIEAVAAPDGAGTLELQSWR